MQVQEIYDINIFIDELSVFEAPGVSLQNANIFEALSNPVPVCDLTLVVPLNWIDERAIVDGTLIKFIIRSEVLNIDDIYYFRIFNISELNVQQAFVQLKIEGVIDFYNGYMAANNYNMFATTSDIFRAIAINNDLTPVIDATNDKQLWVAGENNTYQFLNKMAQFGWIDETSAMIWAVDKYKNLLYKNLTNLFRTRQDNVFLFQQSSYPDIKNKKYCYTQAKGSLQSGVNNLRNGGYGGNSFTFDTNKYTLDTITAKKVVAESKMMNISKDLSKGLADHWYAFNTGNYHANYLKAYKQNKRILSTYSSYVTLSSQFFQPMRIGQVVQYEYIDSQDTESKLYALSGIYMINALHITITLKDITSDIELVMQGLNSVPITQDVY